MAIEQVLFHFKNFHEVLVKNNFLKNNAKGIKKKVAFPFGKQFFYSICVTFLDFFSQKRYKNFLNEKRYIFNCHCVLIEKNSVPSALLAVLASDYLFST